MSARRAWAGVAALLVVAPLAILAVGYANAVADPLVRRLTLRVSDYPRSAAPIRIVLFSDVHVHGPDMPPKRVAKIADQINALRPDLVIGAGDFIGNSLVGHHYAIREAIAPLARLRANYGVYVVLGNGFVNWRTSMSDIAASTRWLASQGVADPKRIAIVGWSYGGYAALMEAETDPSLYKAVVAVAPVTDLGLLKQDSANFVNARMVEDFVGSGPHIVEGSPLRHADKIQAPVLLAHGDMDQNVRFWHSQKMTDALQDAGKTVEFLQYKGLNHQLDDSTARTDLLAHIGALLDRTIGH